MNISTRAQVENNDPALLIQSITKHDNSNGIRCNIIYADYQTGFSGIQNIAIVRMTFLNSWPETSGYVIYRIKLSIHSANIGDNHLVIVETNNQVVQHMIQLNIPLIFQDTNGTILSELYNVFDKNYSSCIRLPVLENTPPLLLMKVNTAWLQISPATYNITIIGEYIACQKHGQKILQVSKIYNSAKSLCFFFILKLKKNVAQLVSASFFYSLPLQQIIKNVYQTLFQCKHCSFKIIKQWEIRKYGKLYFFLVKIVRSKKCHYSPYLLSLIVHNEVQGIMGHLRIMTYF